MLAKNSAGRTTGPLFAIVVSLSALAIAFIAQYGFDLLPCILCVWQRWAYGAALALAVLALLLGRSAALRRLLLLATGVAFLAVTGIAAFHVGVEQGWWRGSSECQGIGISAGMDRDALKNAILSAPTVACDAVAWSLWGVSMAGFNVIFSSIFAAVTFGYAAKARRTR